MLNQVIPYQVEDDEEEEEEESDHPKENEEAINSNEDPIANEAEGDNKKKRRIKGLIKKA